MNNWAQDFPIWFLSCSIMFSCIFRHNGQRDYKCGVCDFYGYTFTDIRKHIERKHTDAKTIICDKCGAAFKTDWHLKVSWNTEIKCICIYELTSSHDFFFFHY